VRFLLAMEQEKQRWHRVLEIRRAYQTLSHPRSPHRKRTKLTPQQFRERVLMGEVGPSDQARADENLAAMYAKRKPNRTSFVNKYPDEVCGKCLLPIRIGERARFRADGLIVHVMHRSTETAPVVCKRCNFVMPCECDE